MPRVITAIGALCLLGSSAALGASPERLVFSYNDDPDGGVLIATPAPDGSWGRMTWEACPPGGPCYAVKPTGVSDHVLHVGSAPAGTVFRATASDGQQSLTATSDAYRGPLRVEHPPRISGQVRVGHVVRAVAGHWSGGWSGEQPFLQIQACRTTRSNTCQVIASTFYWERCNGVAARISDRYEGWYLRVADGRSARQNIYAASGVTRPQLLSPLVASGNTAVRIIGRIRPGSAVGRAC